MEIKLDEKTLAAWKKAIQTKSESVVSAGSEVVERTARRLEKNVSDRIANESTNTGQLLQSIYTNHKGLKAEVGATAAHAPYVEYGTAPHRPPFDPIYEWVWLKRHDMGIDDDDVWAVAKGIVNKIAKLGTEETLHWTDTIKGSQKWFIKEMERAIKGVIG